MRKNRVFLTIIGVLGIGVVCYAYAWVSCHRLIGFIPARTLSVGVVEGALGESYEYEGDSFDGKGPAMAACMKDRFNF